MTCIFRHYLLVVPTTWCEDCA